MTREIRKPRISNTPYTHVSLFHAFCAKILTPKKRSKLMLFADLDFWPGDSSFIKYQLFLMTVILSVGWFSATFTNSMFVFFLCVLSSFCLSQCGVSLSDETNFTILFFCITWSLVNSSLINKCEYHETLLSIYDGLECVRVGLKRLTYDGMARVSMSALSSMCSSLAVALF